jgi:hypothetical protein
MVNQQLNTVRTVKVMFSCSDCSVYTVGGIPNLGTIVLASEPASQRASEPRPHKGARRA